MIRRPWRSVAAATLLLAGSGAASAQVTAQVCVNSADATALATAFLPELLSALAVRCGAALPPDANLRGNLPGLVNRYRAESDQAYPRAAGAIGRIASPQVAGLGPELLRPLVASLIVPLAVGAINAGDCPRIDRAISLLSPLPARNIAGLAVLALEVDRAHHPERARGGVSLCPEPAR